MNIRGMSIDEILEIVRAEFVEIWELHNIAFEHDMLREGFSASDIESMIADRRPILESCLEFSSHRASWVD